MPRNYTIIKGIKMANRSSIEFNMNRHLKELYAINPIPGSSQEADAIALIIDEEAKRFYNTFWGYKDCHE